MSHMQTKISDLRHQSMQKVLESVLAFIAALYTTLLLPQLLLRYVYADQQLTAEPKTLELIPVAAFTVAVLYLIYAVVGNIARSNQIKQLMMEMESMHDDCCHDDLDDAELAELEAMVDSALEDDTASMAEAMKPKKAKKASKKSKK